MVSSFGISLPFSSIADLIPKQMGHVLLPLQRLLMFCSQE